MIRGVAILGSAWLILIAVGFPAVAQQAPATADTKLTEIQRRLSYGTDEEQRAALGDLVQLLAVEHGNIGRYQMIPVPPSPSNARSGALVLDTATGKVWMWAAMADRDRLVEVPYWSIDKKSESAVPPP